MLRRAFAVAAAALALPSMAGAVPLAGGTAYADPAARNGRVMLQWGDRMVTYSAHGTDRRDLGVGTDPKYSPDGRTVAYTVAGNIHLMNADGTGKRVLTSGPRKDNNPAWSPDGTRLVFSSAPTADRTQRSLWVITIATGATRRLTARNDGCAFDPVWAATGRYVVYVDACPAGGSLVRSVRRVDVATGAVGTIVPAGGLTFAGGRYKLNNSRVDLTPDGTRVVWSAMDVNEEESEDGGIAEVRLDGSGARWVDFLYFYWVYGPPVVSPDGRTVIYSYGIENAQIDSSCRVTGCEMFYLDTPELWPEAADWQPVR